MPSAHAAGLREIVRYRQALSESEWWPSEQLAAWQSRQLARLVDHARREVPYYAERLAGTRFQRGAPSAEEWRAIPRLTKAEVRKNAAALRSRASAGDRHVVRRSTSGSTGHPLTVVKDLRPRLGLWAVKLRAYDWFRTDFTGKRMRLAAPFAGDAPGATHHFPDWGTPVRDLHKTGPGCVADVYLQIERQAELLAAEQPHYLVTYASNLQLLLRELRRRGQRVPSLRYVQTQAVQLEPGAREECRDVLGVPLYDVYGATEADWIAVQCPEHDHYHVQSELNFVEVLSDQGRPCEPGEVGRIVVTPLYCYAMPLLRYETTDYAEVGPPCPCGRGLPVLKRLLGCDKTLLTLPSGEKRMAPFGTGVLSTLPAIRQFRMVQTGLHALEVRVVAERALTAEEGGQIVRGFGNQLPEGFTVTVRRVAELARTANGKFLEFVSDL